MSTAYAWFIPKPYLIVRGSTLVLYVTPQAHGSKDSKPNLEFRFSTQLPRPSSTPPIVWLCHHCLRVKTIPIHQQSVLSACFLLTYMLPRKIPIRLPNVQLFQVKHI